MLPICYDALMLRTNWVENVRVDFPMSKSDSDKRVVAEQYTIHNGDCLKFQICKYHVRNPITGVPCQTGMDVHFSPSGPYLDLTATRLMLAFGRNANDISPIIALNRRLARIQAGQKSYHCWKGAGSWITVVASTPGFAMQRALIWRRLTFESQLYRRLGL